MILVIIKKELLAIMRDRKALMISLLLPLLMLPVSLYIMDTGAENASNKVSRKTNISLDCSDKEFLEYIKHQENINIKETKNYKKDLERGSISLHVIVTESKEGLNFSLVDNTTSMKSSAALSIVTDCISAYKEKLLLEKFSNKAISIKALPKFIINVKSISNNAEYRYYIEMLLPILLLVYCCMGISAIANDLGAGEKEKRTLEALFATSAKREDIYIAKGIVTSLVGFLCAIALVLGLELYIFIKSGTIWGSVGQLAVILAIALFYSFGFSFLSMSISFMAKSFKQAQIYTTPLSIISLLPSYYIMTVDTSDFSEMFYHIPILNIICILKETVSGNIELGHLFITLIWSFIYIAVAILFGNSIIKKEDILASITE
jgi:hypothetical protein